MLPERILVQHSLTSSSGPSSQGRPPPPRRGCDVACCSLAFSSIGGQANAASAAAAAAAAAAQPGQPDESSACVAAAPGAGVNFCLPPNAHRACAPACVTRSPDGLKKAYVRLTTDYDALDVANKIGII